VQAVSESVPGSTSDLALLERSGVVERLGPDEAVGVDKAYVGAEARFPGTTFYVPVKKPPGGERTPEETRYNRTLASVRIVVEHFFARLSRFGALAQVWDTGAPTTAESSAWRPGWRIARSPPPPHGCSVPESVEMKA